MYLLYGEIIVTACSFFNVFDQAVQESKYVADTMQARSFYVPPGLEEASVARVRPRGFPGAKLPKILLGCLIRRHILYQGGGK